MTRSAKLTKSASAVAKTMAHVSAGSFYRADLKQAAQARASILAAAKKRERTGKDKPVIKPKRGTRK